MVLWLAACGSTVSVDGPTPVETGTPITTAVGALAFDGRAPKNVWMVSIDTLRRDHVDPLATDGVERMPFLADRLAEGVLLAAHQQCASWTLHSISCTLLGRAPEETGWVPRLDGGRTPAPEGQRTLAVRLREAGFAPIVVSSNGWFGPEWNSVQGYEVVPAPATDALSVGRAGMDALRRQVAAAPEQPWFLHLHLKEPHAPYDPPDAYLGEVRALPPIPWDLTDQAQVDAMRDAYPTLAADDQDLVEQHVNARYDAEIRWLDDEIAQLWLEMAAEGWLDETLVVVWTDHGEAVFDHADWGHGRWLYREENDGVLAFWSKHLKPARWAGPTHGTDLVPTVLSVLGVDPGEVLPGAVVGTADPARVRFSSTVGFDGPTAAVTVSDQKLVYWWDGRLEQYDLAADPGEQRDLFTAGDPTSDALWEILRPRVELLDELLPERAVLP